MRLFHDDAGAAAQVSKFRYLPPKELPPVTADVFASWPAHMQQEFALLVAERIRDKRLSVTDVRKATGIKTSLLHEAAGRAHHYSLPQVLGYHVDDNAPLDPHAKLTKGVADA